MAIYSQNSLVKTINVDEWSLCELLNFTTAMYITRKDARVTEVALRLQNTGERKVSLIV